MDQAKVRLQTLINEVERAEENLSRAVQTLMRAQDSKSAKLSAMVDATKEGSVGDITKCNAQLYHATRWYTKKEQEYIAANNLAKQARYQYNLICGRDDIKRCVMCGGQFIGHGDCCSIPCRVTQDYPVMAK